MQTARGSRVSTRGSHGDLAISYQLPGLTAGDGSDVVVCQYSGDQLCLICCTRLLWEHMPPACGIREVAKLRGSNATG